MKTVKIYHPGKILLAEFLKPANLSPEQLASDISVSPSLIHNIIDGVVDLDKELSIRLALYFKTALTFWLNLQSNYDEYQLENFVINDEIRSKIRFRPNHIQNWI